MIVDIVVMVFMSYLQLVDSQPLIAFDIDNWMYVHVYPNVLFVTETESETETYDISWNLCDDEVTNSKEQHANIYEYTLSKKLRIETETETTCSGTLDPTKA